MLQSCLLLLKVSRPPFWIILPVVFCLGLAYGQHGLADPLFRFTPLMVIQIFMFSFPACLFTFGLNDIHDEAGDRLNPRKTGIEGSRIPDGSHKLVKMSAFGAGVSLLLSSAASANPLNIYFAVTLLATAYVYSTPPWRFKTRPPLDIITAGILGFLAPFGMGFSLADDAMNLPVHALFFTLCVMGFHAFSTISDYSSDKEIGDRTFAVAFGKRAAALLPVPIFLCGFFLIRVDYVRIFFLACAILSLLSAIFPSEKLARYSCIAMFLGAAFSSCFWLGTLALR